jgi:arylsulfatase A-like enzyme
VVSVVWLYIMPNGGVANVWDNHGGTAGLGGITGYAMLKEKYCLPPLDRALAALLEDLSDRGMLDRTLVAVAGEFGRTPKINKDQGRDHWGAAQTALLAGGGVRGGRVWGKTDKQAAYPTESPVSPDDFLATIYHAMGVDPAAMIPDRENRPHRLCDGTPVLGLF